MERPSPRAIVPVPEPAPPPPTIIARIIKALSPRTSPANYPAGSMFLPSGGVGMVNGTAAMLRPPQMTSWRAYAQTPWVFSALNIRKDQVSSAEWDIVPFDNTKRVAARQRDRLLELFDQPSATLDSFQTFTKVVLNELLICDGAPIEKVRTPSGDIGELWPVLSDYIQIDNRWDGSDPEKARYYFVPDGTIRATFRNEDMVYLMANPRAGTPYGISPISVLATIIESELQGIEYNRRQVMGAAPDGVLNIGESAGPDDVQRAESKFKSKVEGQGAMAIIGGFKSPTWMPFRSTNRDMQFREWQDYLIRCIATVLGLSPMDLAITFDVNRSTAEAQGSNTEDRGLRPLMSLYQSYLTREIVWDESFGGRSNNLMFAFKSLNLDESQAKATFNATAMPGIGWKTINEARQVDGRAPIGDPTDDGNLFNHILIGSPKGIIDLNTQSFIGEEQLNQLQTQSKIDLAQAVAEANPQPKEPPVQAQKQAELDDLLQKAFERSGDRQDETLRAIHAVANRPIEVNVAAAPAPNVEVHPGQTTIAEGAVQVTVPAIEMPKIEIPPTNVTVNVPEQAAPVVKIEKGAVQIDPAQIQVDVHVPELKAGDVTVNTPAEIAITKMPKRGTKRVVTKRDPAGGIDEVLDVEADLP